MKSQNLNGLDHLKIQRIKIKIEYDVERRDTYQSIQFRILIIVRMLFANLKYKILIR